MRDADKRNLDGGSRRLGRRQGPSFTFFFDDQAIEAWPGESVAAALLAADIATLRSAEDGGPRGMVCGIGVCWECRCIVGGRSNRRACMFEAVPGLRVETQKGLG